MVASKLSIVEGIFAEIGGIVSEKKLRWPQRMIGDKFFEIRPEVEVDDMISASKLDVMQRRSPIIQSYPQNNNQLSTKNGPQQYFRSFF